MNCLLYTKNIIRLFYCQENFIQLRKKIVLIRSVKNNLGKGWKFIFGKFQKYMVNVAPDSIVISVYYIYL